MLNHLLSTEYEWDQQGGHLSGTPSMRQLLCRSSNSCMVALYSVVVTLS